MSHSSEDKTVLNVSTLAGVIIIKARLLYQNEQNESATIKDNSVKYIEIKEHGNKKENYQRISMKTTLYTLKAVLTIRLCIQLSIKLIAAALS